MPRQKEDRKPFNSTLRTDLYKKLDEYAESTMIPKTKLLDKAMEEFLSNYEIKKKEQP